MATQLVIVNDILRQLRETEVSTVPASSYSKLIAQFVNQAKDDMEDMWFWTANEQTIDIPILADGTREYDLASTTDRSFLQRRWHDKAPMAFDVTSSTEQAHLQDMPLRDLNDWRNSQSQFIDDISVPRRFAIEPAADGRGYGIVLDRGATTARTWRTYWYIPQVELELDGTDDNINIILPKRPIMLKALFYALNERGEEIGEPGQIAEVRAHTAAAAAMEIDMQVNKVSDSRDMTNLEHLRNGINGNIW